MLADNQRRQCAGWLLVVAIQVIAAFVLARAALGVDACDLLPACDDADPTASEVVIGRRRQRFDKLVADRRPELGCIALACSDARFGPMNNLLLPGRAPNMGGGWETRRSRQSGNTDWILVELGARGSIRLVEIDTNHFKGNYPDRFALHACDAKPGVKTTDLISNTRFSSVIPETKLQAHTRHFFPVGAGLGAATHVKLEIFPDGGISRLRVWGPPAP